MNIFSKINQYLLERYPNIWNTKLVWIFLIAFFIHIIFFLIGFTSYINPKSLQQRYVLENFFSSGLILVNIIVSILIIVGWLIYMFKNNSFKNFYPTSNFSLFGQFLQYFIIIFISISFYFSYMFGFQLYIKKEYSNAKMLQEVELINKVYPFLSQNPDDYLITQKQYPEIFSKLYCETDPEKINYKEQFYTFYNSVYQFNELYSKVVTEKDSLGRFVYPELEATHNIPLAYIDEQDNKCIFFFKKGVYDVSEYINNSNLNYGNFSNVFYILGKGSDFNYDYYSGNSNNGNDKSIGLKQNKQTVELLNRNDPKEFEELFSEFLKLSDNYKIKHNLTEKKWLEIVYNPPGFDVKKFILKTEPYENEYNSDHYYTEAVIEPEAVYTIPGEGNTKEDIQVTLKREFIKNNTTDLFYETENLKLFLENIDNVKNNTFVVNSLPVFLWISYILSALIFSFRVTNLRSLLFSIVATGVISLLVSLIFVFISFVFASRIEFMASYFTLILGLIIIAIPILYNKLGSKLFRSILINMSINGIASYFFLIMAIISLHQEEACRNLNKTSAEYHPCNTLIESLNVNSITYIIIGLSIFFFFLYSGVIKKWKASTE